VDRTAGGLQAAEPKGNPRRGPKVREASFQDYDQIALLESRHGLTEKSYEQWSHLWLGNPLYRELQTSWSIGWVLEDEDNQIVGSLGNLPLLYEFEGRRVVVGASRFWVAEPEYRGAALLLVNELVNQRHMDLYLTNTFSAASNAALGVFSFQPVPVGVWDEAAFWITNYRGFLESFLTLKHYPLAKSLSYPFSAAVFLKDRLTNRALRAYDVEVKACPAFDERFDDFWVESKSRSPHVLWAVRTREMLEWHYKYALLNNRVWIATIVDGPRLVAYAVFDRKDKRTIGLKRVRLVDFQSLDGGTALLLPLLFWALRKCGNEGIHVLENAGRWLEKGEVLDTLAPYRRRLPNWRFVYRANDPGLAESLRDRRAWAPSLFDSDASLGW
jgi:RimJ/RimL family protein N-acetyltransferase